MSRPLRSSPISIVLFTVVATLAVSWLAKSISTGSSNSDRLKEWQALDARYLGKSKGDTPPARLDNYKYKTNDYQVISDYPRTIQSV